MATEIATLLFGRKAARIGEIQLDVTLNETHIYDSEITDFPVEQGFDVNDNIRKLPEKLELEGLITNTPLQIVFEDITEQIEQNSNTAQVRTNQRVGDPTFVEVGQNALLALLGRQIQGSNEGEPMIFDIITGLRVYTSMACTSLTFPRDAQTGQAIRIKASFKKINVVGSETIEIPDPQPAFTDKAQSKVDEGKQTPSESNTETTKSVSAAKKAFNKIAR